MTTEVQVSEPVVRAGSGGVPARRAVARWGWRLFRREWRQQIMILVLLSATVAAAIGSMSAAYTMAPVSGNATFGSGNQLLGFEDPDPQAVNASVAAARQEFGTIDVIGHREVAVPGLFKPVDLRSQDPNGPYSGPLLGLRRGAYPIGTGQVALTDNLASVLGVGLGSALTLDGVTRTVVGIVENPSDLGDDFALVAPSAGNPTSVTVLLDADEDRVSAFHPGQVVDRSGAQRGQRVASSVEVGIRSPNENVIAAVIVLVMSTVVLLLAALVATASFVVMAQRRARQLGMLAAIGATEKQLRSVTVINGAVIGAAAALIGCAAGLTGWVAAAPRVESAVGYRIDQFDLPWLLIGAGMVLAVGTATAAAWWPARAVARMPTVTALSGRPPRPRPARRSAAVAVAATATGVGCLVVGGDIPDEAANTGLSWVNTVLIPAGTLALALGLVLATPTAIGLLAKGTRWLPVAVRLAFADLSRFRARSGSALAAISLVLAIAVTITVATTAAKASAASGNLSDRQLILRDAELRDPQLPDQADVNRLRPQVGRIAAELDGAAVTELTVAFDRASVEDPKFQRRFPITFVRPHGDVWQDVSPVYVATPQLLSLYGQAPDDSASGFISAETGDLRIIGVALGADRTAGDRRPEPERVTDLEPLDATYTSLPGTFVTPAELRDRHWEAVPSGAWLIQTDHSLTEDELASAREIAAGAGLTVESRDKQHGLAMLRNGATIAGILVALGILAMTVGLVRSETGRDLRVLTATGARRATRRTITAATAGGLAVLAVLLGVGATYVALAAGFAHHLHALYPIPVLQLAAIAVGVPLVAAIGGWLFSGREPTYLARQPME